MTPRCRSSSSSSRSYRWRCACPLPVRFTHAVQELYLNNACEWGFRRVRAQEQLQYTLLGSLLVVSSRQLGQRVQVRYAQRVREETVRHQAGAQSVRVTALKEAWEKMGEGERGEDVWRKRAEKEKMAYEAHKVQSELLNVRARDTCLPHARAARQGKLDARAGRGYCSSFFVF